MNNLNKHGFPQPLKCLILSKTNSFIKNFIINEWLDFYRVIIFSKELSQYSENINLKETIFLNGKEFPIISIYPSIIPVKNIEGSNILFFFDNIVEDKNEINKYLNLSKYKNFHVIFIYKNYNNYVRQFNLNLNCIIFFKQSTLNLKKIYKDFILQNNEESLEDFILKCSKKSSDTFAFKYLINQIL